MHNLYMFLVNRLLRKWTVVSSSGLVYSIPNREARPLAETLLRLGYEVGVDRAAKCLMVYEPVIPETRESEYLN